MDQVNKQHDAALSEILDAMATHPYWAHHSDELWSRFLAGLKQQIPINVYERVCRTLMETWKTATADDDEAQLFELQLRHACVAGACADRTCTLCENSASRPCEALFKTKYLLRDPLLPACGAASYVSLQRKESLGANWSHQELQSLPQMHLQVCALPEEYYNIHKDSIPWATVHESKTITVQDEGEQHDNPILHCERHGCLEADGFISFPHGLNTGHAVQHNDLISNTGIRLPNVFFAKRSAVSLLGGQQPHIVLVVRAVHAHTGAPILSIRPAVSSSFCVATRRTKSNDKAYIPSTDQHVRVLEHVGGACITNLADIRKLTRHCDDIVVPSCVPSSGVFTVGHMVALIRANQDNQTAEKKLFQGILSMNEAKRRELWEQVARAVRPDSQLRVFYCGTYPTAPLPYILDGAVDMGLVFTCTRGTVDLYEGGICGVVMRSPCNHVEVIVPKDHLIQEPQLVPLLLTHARSAWRTPGHPGWSFYKFQGKPAAHMPGADGVPYHVDHYHVPCFTPTAYTGDVVCAGEAPAEDPAADTPGGAAAAPASGGTQPNHNACTECIAHSIASGGSAAHRQSVQPEDTEAADSVPCARRSADDHARHRYKARPSQRPPGASWMDTNAIAASTPFGAADISSAAGVCVEHVAAELFQGVQGISRKPADVGRLVRGRDSVGEGDMGNVPGGKRARRTADDHDGNTSGVVEVRLAAEAASSQREVEDHGMSSNNTMNLFFSGGVSADLRPNPNCGLLSSLLRSASMKLPSLASGDLASTGGGGTAAAADLAVSGGFGSWSQSPRGETLELVP